MIRLPMIRLAAKLLAPALLVAAPSVMAQGANMSPAVAARLKAMPTDLAGLSPDHGDSSSGYGTSMRAYRGRDALAPVIAVVLADAPSRMSLADMAENGRAGPRQAGLIDTMFEGKFSLDGRPSGRNFFGDYVTKQGVKQSWIAEVDGVRITVLATIYRADDRRKVFDAIRRDLLGGITMEKLSIAEAN